jgi:hypothetical protein
MAIPAVADMLTSHTPIASNDTVVIMQSSPLCFVVVIRSSSRFRTDDVKILALSELGWRNVAGNRSLHCQPVQTLVYLDLSVPSTPESDEAGVA